jgi:hypothetical protein
MEPFSREALESFIDQAYFNSHTMQARAINMESPVQNTTMLQRTIESFLKSPTGDSSLDNKSLKMATPTRVSKRKPNSPLTELMDNNENNENTIVSQISSKIQSANTEVKDLLQNLTLKVNEMHSIVERQADKIKEVDEKVDTQAQAVSALIEENTVLRNRARINEGRLTRLEKLVHDVQDKQVKQQQHSMKDNLVFMNICEESQHEDLQKILYDFMADTLKICGPDLDRIEIFKVHRMGGPRRKGRSIIANVNDMGKQIIMKHVKHLKDKDANVFIQMPSEMVEQKKRLMPFYKEAKKKNINTRWMGEKLLVGDQTMAVRRDQVLDINIDTTGKASMLKVRRSPPLTFEGSTFQGASVTALNQDDIIPALHALYADSRVARATHNIYAYRLSGEKTLAREHYDDDGEYGAGQRLLDLLKQHDITDTLVCVSRWYGGKNLGPKRFEKILDCAKQTLQI